MGRRSCVLAYLLALATSCVGGGAGAQTFVSDSASAPLPRLEIHPGRSRVFVGEVLPVKIALVAEPATVRNIQFPSLDGPAYRIDPFAAPHTQELSRDGRKLTIFEFSTTVVPSKAGKHLLGPAGISFDHRHSGIGAADFFGGGNFESSAVRSAAVELFVQPLPESGRPNDFSGAVGQFAMMREIETLKGEVGQPIRLMTVVTGVGNFDTLECPQISLPQVRDYSPALRKSHQRMECEQILVPVLSGELEIPGIKVSYFDPRQRKYRTATAAPIKLTVNNPREASIGGNAANVSPSNASEGGPRHQSSAAISFTSLVAAMNVWLALIAVVLVILAAWLITAWMRNVQARPQHIVSQRPDAEGEPAAEWVAAAQQALENNSAQGFYTAAFRTIQAHLARRYDVQAASLTRGTALAAMRKAKEPEAKIAAVAKMLEDCDAVRYGYATTALSDMNDLLEQLLYLLQADATSNHP